MIAKTPQDRSMPQGNALPAVSASAPIAWPLLALFAATALPIALLGLLVLHKEIADSRRQAGEQLAAIADLKVRQIAGWRKERLNDADWVYRFTFLRDHAGAFFDNPAAGDLRDRIHAWLTAWTQHFDFREALLLDTQLHICLSVPPGVHQRDATLDTILRTALQTDTVQMGDLHMDPVDRQIKMQMVVPVRTWGQGQTPPPIGGLLVLEIDPESFLFPYIETWPTPSRTAETLVVRREGDEVVFLNELRHQAGTALTLRVPVSHRSLPAARLLRDEEGLVEGPDYRGEPVLAAIRHIPDSPWGIVAKVDQAEIYSPLRRRVWTTVLIMGGLLLVLLLTMMLLWRNREISHIRCELEERKRHQEEREQLLRELESKNEELESLVYAASHDLRAPLVNIEGFSKHLQTACGRLSALLRTLDIPSALRTELDQALEERIPKAMTFIHSSVTKMSALISGLLRVSRLGNAPLDLRRLDMDRLVQEVVSTQAFQIQQVGADVRVEPLPPCTGDAAMINQVFSNLLDNAQKYRDPSRPLHVTISGKVDEQYVTYYVADTGRGIAPEHQEKIWVLFHRLHPEQGVPGEGLGLTLVRRILDRHRGRVWVESTPGAGSRFYVSLPLASA